MILHIYPISAANTESILRALLECVPQDMRPGAKHIVVDDWSAKLVDRINCHLPNASVGRDYMRVVYSRQSSNLREKHGSCKSKLISTLRLVVAKIMRTDSTIPEPPSVPGTIRDISEKVSVFYLDGVRGEPSVPFISYDEYVGSMIDISRDPALTHHIQKKTSHGYTRKDVIVIHCRYAAPHVRAHIRGGFAGGAFGAAASKAGATWHSSPHSGGMSA